MLGRDADQPRGMASGILKQVSEHFGEIGPVDRRPLVLADPSFKSYPLADRCPGKGGNERVDERLQFSRNLCSPQYAAASPGARQLAINMTAHRLCDAFYVFGDDVFATLMQSCGVGSKGCEWCFQSVRQIGRSTSRSFNLFTLQIDEGIHFFDERFHLCGDCARQVTTASSPDVGHAAPHCIKGTQTERNLDGRSDRENATEKAKRKCEILGECERRCRQPCRIGTDHDAHRDASVSNHQTYCALRYKQAPAGWPHYLVLVNLTWCWLVGRKNDRGVPKRSRAQKLAAAIADLPVETR
jgi:hypothetical protein